jgi:hypothetical protein
LTARRSNHSATVDLIPISSQCFMEFRGVELGSFSPLPHLSSWDSERVGSLSLSYALYLSFSRFLLTFHIPHTLLSTLQKYFFFCIFFWRARVCRPLLRLCRPFMIFEGCLDSNPEYCRSKLAEIHVRAIQSPNFYLSFRSI